jgi:drug/metabolite transporter superfamily protein YnfA
VDYTGALEGFFGKRLLSRLFDAFGGIVFMVVSLAWLLVVFPFDFAYFADVLPVSLRFLVQWISNGIAQGILVLGAILLAVAAVYSPIAYKFVSVKRFRRKEK